MKNTRVIALAVLGRALDDARGKFDRSYQGLSGTPREVMLEARDFIEQDSEILGFWCDVAGVSVEEYRVAANQHLGAMYVS